MAFVRSRLGDATATQDVVQETFFGFYRSLPNFDATRSIEAYLYQICAYKITDHLRRSGRKSNVSLQQIIAPNTDGDSMAVDFVDSMRVASSLARGNEKRKIEEQAIVKVLQSQVEKWIEKGEYIKLMCIELIIAQNLPNKDVADRLSISQQQVANYKADFLTRTKILLSRLDLSQEQFPELHG